MEQDKEKTPPSSAGCDTDGCEERENSAQKDEMNEKRKESLFEHEEGQRSITEEQEIADEEISGKVVQEKVPAETISNLPPKTYFPQRKSDSKQSTPHSASSSVPSCSEISNVIFRGSRTAEKQKEQMFPFKWTKPGSLTDSVPFSAAFDSNVTSHNTPKVEQPVKEIKKPDHATLVQQNTLTALREKIKRKSGLCSPALSGPSSSSHLSSLSESIGLFDTTSPYSPCNRSLINIIGESLQKDAFSVQSRSEPEVNHSFVGDMGSLVTAEQSLIRKKNGADKSKPKSKVFSTSSFMSGGILRDLFKDSTPGTDVYPETMNFVLDTPKYLFQPLPSSPVHPSPAVDQSPSSDYLPSSQPSFIHEPSEKQQTADEKFSEEEVQVKPSSQSVSSLPHSSFSSSDSSICYSYDCYIWDTLLKSSTPSSHSHYYDCQEQQQEQQEQQLQQLPLEMDYVACEYDLQSSTSNDSDSDFSLLADAFSPWPESESGGDRDVHVEMEGFVTAVNVWATNTWPTHARLLQTPDCFRSRRASSCLRRSHSVSSLSHTGSAENKLLRRTISLPNMLLKSSVVDFTPVITDDGYDESYRFLCSSPGLYHCSVTDLVFHMDGEGEVVYRIIPWNRRLLAQHHKQPAGPLFDIECLQQSVCQLHLPHCEIRSKGGCKFLSVAHVHDEGIEFISPHQITDTHVIINITGFSGFGNVKDEDSPPDPVRALVLLFYKPPAAPDVTSVLSVLMLPRNVVLREVLRTRKKLVGDENYIDRPPHCKLYPQQEYTLSTRPEDESVLIQPKTAEFECESYDNYFSSFQVDIEQILKHINLFLRDSNEHSIWERRVCLSSTGVKRSCVQSELTERLLQIRSSFIDGISGPVLKSLLDRLLEKTVITDSERESADAIQDKGDKARLVIDTVRKKGEAASSEMIEYLCEVDPFLCEHLGLI